jgi:hypothetical protein
MTLDGLIATVFEILDPATNYSNGVFYFFGVSCNLTRGTLRLWRGIEGQPASLSLRGEVAIPGPYFTDPATDFAIICNSTPTIQLPNGSIMDNVACYNGIELSNEENWMAWAFNGGAGRVLWVP